MKIIKPSIKIESNVKRDEILSLLERAGRTCYKSENLIKENSASKFIKAIVKRGHESVIEHASISVKIVCDRGVTHELVRHRIASYSQESTRYCNYTGDKFGNELTFIEPSYWTKDSAEYELWKKSMKQIEEDYFKLVRDLGTPPERARAILPNSLKTEIVITTNLREWRNILKLRTNPASHPQMVEVANMILDEFTSILPEIFADLKKADFERKSKEFKDDK